MATSNCQYSTRYCWDADKVKSLIRLRAELSPLFTGKRNASKYAWAVVERELNVPLPLSKIIKKWNNLLQEYKAIKISEEPKRREWPFFTLMDVYFSDQVNDPSLRLFSSTKTLKESLDESVFEDDPIIVSAIAAVTSGASMEIEELLKRQKDRRANEQKYAPDINSTSENQFVPEKYKPPGNKTNVVSVKNLNFMQQQPESENNANNISDQQNVVKNENFVSPKPILRQQPQPSPPEPNSIDQYLLSWNNFLGNMSRGFHTLQKDEKMVDVTIAAGGKIFKAHKLVLSVCSPYFQEIFLENPSNHPILLMADVEANHMAGLLNFMYSGQVNVKYEDLPVFLKVAEAMKIKGLHTEKPEGQNLDEIQFSREDNSSSLQALNSHHTPINSMDHSTPTPYPSEKEQNCHTSFYPIDRKKNKELQPYKMMNYEQPQDKFSILKTNGSRKLSEHLKQQKYLTKRKIFVHCENEYKEKGNMDISDKPPFNNTQSNLIQMTHQTTIQPDHSHNEEILNLAQYGAPNVPQRFVPPPIPMNTKNDNTCNQTPFVEIPDKIHKDTYMDNKISNEDGNNNTVNIDDITFYPINKNVVPNENHAKNCYNPNNPVILTNSNEKSKNDDNNNGSTASNYDVKINLKKQADDNNNVFLETSINIDKNKDSMEEIKVKPYSNPS